MAAPSRVHWRACVTWAPVQLPSAQLSTLPATVSPITAGGVVLAGGSMNSTVAEACALSSWAVTCAVPAVGPAVSTPFASTPRSVASAIAGRSNLAAAGLPSLSVATPAVIVDMPPPVAIACGLPAAVRTSHGSASTSPVVDEQPGVFGPSLQPHQLPAASIVCVSVQLVTP